MICCLIISIMIIISMIIIFFAFQLCLCYLSGSDIHSLGLRSMLEITAAYSDDVSPLLQKNLVWLEVSFRFNVDYVLSLRRIGRWTSVFFHINGIEYQEASSYLSLFSGFFWLIFEQILALETTIFPKRVQNAYWYISYPHK